MPKFCKACKRVLTRDTSTGFAVFTCKCGLSYDASPEDSLISSSFAMSNGFDMNTVLKFATQDRVNYQEDLPCPGCSRLYMTLVGTESGYWFKCDNPKCNTILNGDRTPFTLN